MLAYVLALVIGLGSLAIYMAAFFFPEVHRKSDFLWSAVGLFYALVLWVCAGRITGGVLLGQVASVALLGWLGWETLNLRREQALPEERTQISPQVQEKIQGFSFTELGQKLQQQLSNRSKNKPPESKTPPTVTATPQKTAPSEPTATVESATPTVTQTGNSTPTSAGTINATDSSEFVTIIDSRTPLTETAPERVTTEAIASSTLGDEPAIDSAERSETSELVRPNPPDPELVEAAQNTSDETPAGTQPIEEIAPEVELAPPAEPLGDGDPQMRQNPPEVDIAIEGVPVNPENPPKLS